MVVMGTATAASSYLIDETPGHPDTLLDVSDDPVSRLQARVVVQSGPNLAANLLRQKLKHFASFGVKFYGEIIALRLLLGR